MVESPPTRSPIGMYGPTDRVRPGGERIEALRSGGSEVEIKYLLRNLLWRMRVQEDEKERLTGDSELGLMAAAMEMRRWLAQHPGPEVEVVLKKVDGGTRVVEIPWASCSTPLSRRGQTKREARTTKD